MNLSSDTFGFKYRVRHPLTLDRGPGTGVRGCVTRSPHTSTPPPPWHEETRLLGRVSFLCVVLRVDALLCLPTTGLLPFFVGLIFADDESDDGPEADVDGKYY